MGNVLLWNHYLVSRDIQCRGFIANLWSWEDRQVCHKYKPKQNDLVLVGNIMKPTLKLFAAVNGEMDMVLLQIFRLNFRDLSPRRQKQNTKQEFKIWFAVNCKIPLISCLAPQVKLLYVVTLSQFLNSFDQKSWNYPWQSLFKSCNPLQIKSRFR